MNKTEKRPFNFIQFTGYRMRGGTHENKITVMRNGHIGLLARFISENDLGEYRFASLYVDAEKQAIGIVFVNDEVTPGRFTLRKEHRGGGAQIGSKRFFKKNRISTANHAGRYDYEKKPLRELGIERAGDMYIFKLIEAPEATEASDNERSSDAK